MRYIDTSKLEIPENWQELAKQSNYSPLWSYLKPKFESIVGKKCWYNESINDGSTNPIDHFRPKAQNCKCLTNKYATLEESVWDQLSSGEQTGYPFLEFEHLNYRYACGYSNSGHKRESVDGVTRGKWDFFPLRLGTISANSAQNLNEEQFALLDPCNSSDPSLLTFDEFGGIIPSEKVQINSWDYCRVKVSIEVYHLLYSKIAEKRLEKWTATVRLIELASKLYHKTNKSIEEHESFTYFFENLVRSIYKDAEYSAVAIDCIKYFLKRKSTINYDWLSKTVPENLLEK
ncbi:hypothetical protein [uncultured Sphingobacterium sp.]|uniref:hypothetical protein n=1 Tax=uncultured Sphingobacterium sp. TaxID=182688 RepID=UPI0025EE307D|nr:hypothetical protein [uncultured Sphingobacterium sp.]